MFRIASVLLFCLLGTTQIFAQTAPPVDGIYWNPNENGRGYAVETQNQFVFIAIYDYAPDSSSAFYTVQGTWDPINRRVQNAELLSVASGPWIGAAYAPIGALTDEGPVTFEFPTFTTARFVYNGHTVNLQRFLYGYGANADSLATGFWHSTFGDIVAFGDFLTIDGPCTIAECADISEAFVGTRANTDRVLVGGRLDDGRVLVLLDSSTSYYALYVFDLRVNQWVGFENTFLKTDTDYPTSGSLMIADRVFGPAFVPASAAVEKRKREFAVELSDSTDTLISQAQQTDFHSAADKRLRTGDTESFQATEVRSMLPILQRAVQALH